jgi:poly-gamma-glutamate capsule biosynthesis protein CapA/YwtB (metallophosphatase superfamily)
MTGRGVDQILPHASPPQIFEPYVQDAREYVEMAESVHGPIPRPVSASYIWGDALEELTRVAPDARIVNLETSVTRSDDYWKGKGINYRMHPDNVACLAAARIDVCALANNHVLDYGYVGLVETLETLMRAGLKTAGAGRTLAQADEPAIVQVSTGSRVVVFAVGAESSGIFPSWGAREDRPGVALLADLSRKTANAIVARVQQVKRPSDVIVASIHWGTNWGYEVPPEHVQFAHWLVDGGVDIVHGHSSHHPRPMEVYRKRLILYGCGDFINDYEVIEGYEQYRDDLVLMYFAALSPATGELIEVSMTRTLWIAHRSADGWNPQANLARLPNRLHQRRCDVRFRHSSLNGRTAAFRKSGVPSVGALDQQLRVDETLEQLSAR